MQVKQVKRLIRIKPVYRVMKGSQRLKLPGFEGLSFYVVSKFFIEGLKNGALNMRASSLAFSFFLALFPTIIFLFTLIPYIPIDNFQDYLFNLLQNIMPKSAFEATEGTIADIIKNQRGGLLSFGFLSALYFSTNGFNAMINAFNETYHEIETRTAIGQRLASFYMLFITVILISTAIGLVIGTEIGFKYLIHKDKSLYYILNTGKWIILAGLCYSLISFHYFATVLIIIASLAFGYYVNNFGNYNKLYGSIGTLIVIMMWIYINSLILLLGFDLNVSIHSAKKQSLIRLHLLGHH